MNRSGPDLPKKIRRRENGASAAALYDAVVGELARRQAPASRSSGTPATPRLGGG